MVQGLLWTNKNGAGNAHKMGICGGWTVDQPYREREEWYSLYSPWQASLGSLAAKVVQVAGPGALQPDAFE